ncbi:MAG: xylulokinase [Planctomycetota bacterium]|nr:MAG: xylulokinase [Planctomycetota bacterium]
MDLFLGLDLGTQGVKALVFHPESRRILSRGSAPLDILPPARPGAAEQRTEDWWPAVVQSVQQALAGLEVDPSCIRAIGVSGQQHGLVALDEQGQCLRPVKLWCDTETAAEAEELSSGLHRPIPAGFTASKILWMKRHEPENFRRLRWVLLPHDWLNYRLTGKMRMEAGDASGTGLWNLRSRSFDQGAMSWIDPQLASTFPDLLAPEQWHGELQESAASALGLRTGTLVAPGSGDNMMSALGSGAFEEGVFVCSLGTSGTIFGRSEQPIEDPKGWVAPFCDAAGAWLPLLCTMNCTTVLEEVRKAFDSNHEALTALAEGENSGSDGISFLPYFQGERVPDWPHARAAVLGLEISKLRPGLLYRAAMEGASFALFQGWRHMTDFGLSASEFRVVGGGAQNLLWVQTLADLFDLPFRFPAEAESAALGGALQAAALYSGQGLLPFLREQGIDCHDRIVEPNPDHRDRLDAAFQQFLDQAWKLFGPEAR